MSGQRRALVIFGAGDFGKQALTYYDTKNVAFFVDNSSAITGKVQNGKTILAWNEYINIADNFETVVAIRKHDAVDNQLRQAGISFYHFSPDWLPRWGVVLERLRQKFAAGIRGNVICLGAGMDATAGVADMVTYLLRNEASLCLADVSGSEYIGKILDGRTVYEFSENMQADEIIISEPWRSRELEVIAMSIFRGQARITNPFFPLQHDESGEVIYNPYEGEAYLKDFATEADWYSAFNLGNDIDGISSLAKVLYEHQPLFRHVEIETINRCNGTCSFCPVSAGHDIREKKYMQDELFQKIIDELEKLKFDGRVALFSNDEPLLDPKLVERQKYVHEHLPLAKTHIFTNGTLLTLDKFLELIPYVDELVIDNYDQNLRLISTSRTIAAYCELHPELKRKVSIMLRKPDEILTSRGGDAPNRKEKREFTTERCVLPFQQLIIRPDGKISLCCNDPYGKMTLGDASKQSLQEIWYSKEFKKVRNSLIKGRGSLPHCRYCDTFYYSLGS